MTGFVLNFLGWDHRESLREQKKEIASATKRLYKVEAKSWEL